MKAFSDFLEGRCWPGHKPVPGKKPFSPGSCVKEEDMEEDWSQKYKSSIDCDNPKGFSQKAHCAGKKKNESVNEDLRNWFDPNHPKGGWKRVNSKGEVVGDCAREPGEPKPKCMSNAQRASLSKKEKASAVRRKRKEDPNPERQGDPINVKSKVNENMEQLDEKNKPTNPELWSRAIAQAKSKFDVYPSAYANGWASKWYKEKGGGWKSVDEAMEVGDDPVNQGTPEGIGRRGNKTVLKKFKELSSQVKEAKEKTEYDYEGDMARGQLQSIINNAQKVHDMLEDNDNLPEWVQSKITLSEDYISTVANYLMSELDEVVVIKTNRPIGVRVSDVGAGGKEYNVKTDKAYDNAQAKKKLPQGADFAAERRKERLASNGRMDEEQHSVLYKMKKDDEKIAVAHYKSKDDAHKFLSSVKTKGGNGIVRTKTNEEVEIDEEQLDELSKNTLKSYITKATKDMGERKRQETIAINRSNQDRYQGKYAQKSALGTAKFHKDKALSRASGIGLAARKFAEEVESIDEGRPSQQHPLEGHDYHRKTNAELEYIAKDAHRAAEAMKSHNTTAENKYRDQASDSATVRHFRKTSGTPDWYKKKYGHVKEAVEPKDNKPPFEGPYKKTQVVVTDKSGAKHGSMSRARDLAKQAAKRQAGSMKEEKQKSRKAQIIKNASKGNDKFEKDPIITDTTVKTDNLQ